MASVTSIPTLATSVQVLKELCEQMGLKGIELRDFIKEQQEMEREERTKQREYKKENAKLAADEQDKQRVFEQENQKIEAERAKTEADKLVFLKEKQEQKLQIEKDRQAYELMKIKAQHDHS